MLGKTLAEKVLEEIGSDLERLSFSWDCGCIGAGPKRP
jgi:hypothetical protein